MGSGGPLCTRGFSIERQGTSYTHMALQVMHCMLWCSSYLIWFRVFGECYFECCLCYHINSTIRNGLWGTAVHNSILHLEARRQLCTYGFRSDALPVLILILPDMTWNSFWLLLILLHMLSYKKNNENWAFGACCVTTSNMAFAKLHVHRRLPIFKAFSCFGGLLCTRGGSIERQGASYAHMA